ncbi:MAG TPA: GvpL/GvpF family gas vesicle protein [Verrucomicrobiae bacterium]|jgi:hypothetical protein|nr:GvpL/GvpF family gas vesicle protein [Verrucomicrobiae bacterium]
MKATSNSGPGLYLYGVSRSAAARPARLRSAGVDGVHPPHPRACDEFVCWVSDVDPHGFAAAMQRNMENLDWLALHSVRHQQVVGEIAAKTTVIPARFATVFSGEAALFKNVRARKSALGKVFLKIANAEEWGVKVFAEARPARAATRAASSGKQYLQQKAARLKQRPGRNDTQVAELATKLERLAQASAPTGKVSGARPDLLWQATFLLSRARRKQWDQTLKQFVKRWEGARRIEVNGPWPPYSFVSDAE